ncbi:MAG: RHS repeat-associated core domain-containing protein, partial [Paludibacteraceae bacterium]|nr:RHS repeat-associated core domain-containing protein [Paludibacteraceae bacterium]
KYDEYEQRSFIRYGNGTETTYKYEDGLRRLKNMMVANKEEKVFLNNTYTYDKVNNILSVVNAIDKEKALNAEIGGTTSHTYTYDDWHRLKTATGNFNSFDGNKSADYQLVMGYDNLYNITSKKMTMTQTNLQFAGKLSAGHEFSYNYSTDNPMQLASVETKQYNVDGEVSDVDAKLADNQHVQSYEFDANGNMTSVSVAKKEEPKPEVENPEGQEASEEPEEKDILKSFLWDEENRLLAVNNNGSVSCYFYDAAGERTVKLTSETEMVHVNGKKVGGNDAVTKFTAYVSPYFVVSNGGAYTKHIYAASQRIASKLGNEDGFGADPRRVEMAGGKKISDIQKDNIGARYKELGFTYSAPEKEKVEKDSTMDSEEPENLVFFYHPDHLGSTSYVTDADGNIAQHVEYIPYGEVFVEERNSQFSTNFLFNAKELDNETGLYYYGARYLDPAGAMWLSVDPLYEKNISATPYNYCLNNPVVMVDPDGRDAKVKGSGTEDDPYVITAVYFYDDKIDEDSQKGLISAISSYNNKGKLWKVGKRKERIFVKFDLSAEKVENAHLNLRHEKKIDDVFSFGNIVDNKANPGAFGSSDFRSISINESKIESDVEKLGYNKSSLIRSTWIHEIGHNLGLEHSDGSEIMEKANVTFSTDQLGKPRNYYSYPSLTDKGV